MFELISNLFHHFLPMIVICNKIKNNKTLTVYKEYNISFKTCELMDVNK